MAGNSDIVVFLGPTMLQRDARVILEATYLPPAKQSDIIGVIQNLSPRIICLIDGEFGQSLAVWHREILYALSVGVHVCGASSMGALRAAETDTFGMVGVGRIYDRYASGELQDDDEVALDFVPDLDYLNLTIPMVNIRETLAVAVASGKLNDTEANRFIAAAKRLHFSCRTIDEINIEANSDLILRDKIKNIFKFSYVDLKRLDAIELLSAVSSSKIIFPPCIITFNRTTSFQTQWEQDRPSNCLGETTTQREIYRHFILHSSDSNQTLQRVLLLEFACQLAEIIGLTPNDEDVAIEIDQIIKASYTEGIQDTDSWIRLNESSAEELRDIARKEVLLRKLSSWLIGKRGPRELTGPTLTELKRTNKYKGWVTAAANKRAFLKNAKPLASQKETSGLTMYNLLVDQARCSSWAIPADLDEWLELTGFSGGEDLRRELFLNWLSRSRSKDVKEYLVRNFLSN